MLHMFDCKMCAAKDSDQDVFERPKIKIQSHEDCSWSLR
jgi:hypothetical protein